MESLDKGSSLAELQHLLKEDSTLILPKDNPEFLLRFLRVRNYEPDLALKMVKDYFNLRQKDVKYFQKIVPSILKPILDRRMHLVLKHRDLYGRKVFLFRTGLWNPVEVSVNEVMTATLLLLEELSYSHKTQRDGVVLIADQTGLEMKHFRQFSISKVITILAVLQGKFPLRCKGLHSINEPPWLKRLASFAKPLFSRKLQNRVHFHGNSMDSLHEFFSPKILPQQLGGVLTWDSCNHWELLTSIYSKEAYYKELLSYGYKG